MHVRERRGKRESLLLSFFLPSFLSVYLLPLCMNSLDVHVLQVLIFLLIGDYLKRENFIFVIKRICHSLAH